MFLSGTQIFKSCPEKVVLATKRVEVGGGKRWGTELYQEGKNVIHSVVAFSNQRTEQATIP